MENSAKNDVWATQVPDNVDDIYIAAFEVEIDGVDGVLGSAGPIFIDSETNLPISGRMKFDKEDLAWLSTEAWENTVVHEMGHVLGIGSLVSCLKWVRGVQRSLCFCKTQFENVLILVSCFSGLQREF